MLVTQVRDICNQITSEVIGEQGIQLLDDLSNVVDLGRQILNLNGQDRENYLHQLPDHIGKVVFVNRAYRGSAPSVLMDGTEYGSIVEKIRVELPEAQENQSWELVRGQSYDDNIFNPPVAHAKFFNQKTTFEVRMSFTDKQVRSAFSSATQLNAFFNMIENAIQKSMTIKRDGLIMTTINNFIGETLYDLDNTGTYTGKTGVRAINLLHKYNTKFGTALTADQAITTPEFIRYASMMIGLTADRMTKVSKLFNIGGTDKFTTKDLMHIVMLSDFGRAADAYLQSDTYHDEFTKLPEAELVPFWQGSGTDYEFANTSKIHVMTASGHEVEASGILGVIFDRDALGVYNYDQRVTSKYVASAEFTNNWYKEDASYFNDLDENFVLFYVA